MVKKSLKKTEPSERHKYVETMRSRVINGEATESEETAVMFGEFFLDFFRRLPEFRQKILACDCLIDKELGTLPQIIVASSIPSHGDLTTNMADCQQERFWQMFDLFLINSIEENNPDLDRTEQARLLNLDRSSILRRKQEGEAQGFWPLRGARRDAKLARLRKASEALERESEPVPENGDA